jgi:aminopeptidase N
VHRAVVALAAVSLAVAIMPAQAREADQPDHGSAGIGDAYFPLDGNGGIDVLHYDVRDRYRFGSGRLSGRTTLTVRATEDLSRFNLDFLLGVSAVRVDGARASFDRRRGHELRITPRTPIPAGRTVAVEVRYSGRPADEEYLGESNWLADSREVVTVNEPHMAPWWFPANDHPRDKATMDVRITVPKRRQVVSNGSLVRRVVKGDVATTHWRSTEPMAPYLAFFAAGRFAVRHGALAGRPYVVAVSRQLTPRRRRAATDLMLRSAPLTAWLETQLGPYPFSSTGGLVTSLRTGFALETQTRPVYPAVGPESAQLVVHELAHQWFGDAVSVDRWRDIWLNEGFATFMEHRWVEATGGRSADDWLSDTYDQLSGEATFWQVRIGDPGRQRLFDHAVYVRGAMTIQALRNKVGEEAFWTTLRTWLATRNGRGGSVADFRALATSVSGQDLDGFFDAWLTSTTRPAKTAANGFTG